METEPELVIEADERVQDEETSSTSLHRHRLNPVSLAFGVLFVGIGLAFSLGDIDMSDLSSGWVWGAVSMAIGVLLLAAAAGRHRR